MANLGDKKIADTEFDKLIKTDPHRPRQVRSEISGIPISGITADYGSGAYIVCAYLYIKKNGFWYLLKVQPPKNGMSSYDFQMNSNSCSLYYVDLLRRFKSAPITVNPNDIRNIKFKDICVWTFGAAKIKQRYDDIRG